jgi:hypothetical protein
MTEAILDLYHHRKEGEKMGEEGRKFVVDHYSRRSLALTYGDVLKEAIEEYAKGRAKIFENLPTKRIQVIP